MSHLARGSPVPPRFGSPCAMGPADPPSGIGTSTPGAEPVAAHLHGVHAGRWHYRPLPSCATLVSYVLHMLGQSQASAGDTSPWVGSPHHTPAVGARPTAHTPTPHPSTATGGGPCCTQLLTSVGPPALTGGCPPSPDRHGRPAPHTLTAHTLSPLPAVGLSPTTDPSPPTHPCGVPSTDQ